MEARCGCRFDPGCCVCQHTLSDCYPYHYAASLWRVYRMSGRIGPDCKDKNHASLFGRGPKYRLELDAGRHYVWLLNPQPHELALFQKMADDGDQKMVTSLAFAGDWSEHEFMNDDQYGDFRTAEYEVFGDVIYGFEDPDDDYYDDDDDGY